MSYFSYIDLEFEGQMHSALATQSLVHYVTVNMATPQLLSNVTFFFQITC